MQDKITFTRSILDLLPDPRQVLAPIGPYVGSPDGFKGPECSCKYIGGLHNLSMSDKIRWGRDEDKDILIMETGTNRCEYYPRKRVEFMDANRYRIKRLTFINTKKGLKIHSHLRYHDRNAPEPAVLYTSGHIDDARPEIAVYVHQGNMNSEDFWNRDNNTHNYNITAKQFVRRFEGHDYLSTIIINDLKERWHDNKRILTTYGSLQLVLNNPRTPEDGDPSTEKWIQSRCKHQFFPLEDEVFEDETDEFHFLTDMAW